MGPIDRGIGPVIAAGLLANIDIKQAPTVGHIWRFAGLDPTNKWIGKKGAETLIDEIWEQGEFEAALAETARRLNTTPKQFAQRLIDKKTGRSGRRTGT